MAWYDEVVHDQMLSYLDEATAAVQRCEILAKFPNGARHRTYGLHISRCEEASFRITPVLPPPDVSKQRAH